jgi:hypothetical protein
VRALRASNVWRSTVVLLVAALAVLASAGASSTAAAGSTHTKVVHDCNHPVVKPSRIIIACGDGNFYLARLHWGLWNGYTARGHGRAWANDCIPDCADGHFHHYAVRVALTRVWATKGYGWLFHRADLYYPHGHPGDRRHQRVRLPPY